MSPIKPPSTPEKTKDKSYASFLNKPASVKILVTVLLSCKNPDAFGIDMSNVDWDLVAQRLNLKNSRVASVRFGQVKKELLECAEAMAVPGLTATGGSEDEKGAVGTPTKIAKGRAAKTKGRRPGRPRKVKEEVEEEAVEGEGSDVGGSTSEE
ncbi:hypothetical protein ABW19_dt0207274 [Dactylella cylindrospora]|nr:hypothetical protein ABW19_dt0207274 [Dactylella cylindrospora]